MSRSLLDAVSGIKFVSAPFPRPPNPEFRLDDEGMPVDPTIERYLNPVHPLLTNPFDGSVTELLEALGREDEVVVDPAAFARLVMLANSLAEPPLHAGSGKLLKDCGAYLLAPRVQVPVFGSQIVIDDGDLFAGLGPDGPARLPMDEWAKITVNDIEERTEAALNSGDTHLISQAMVSAIAGLNLGPKEPNPEPDSAPETVDVDVDVAPNQNPLMAALGQVIQEALAGDFVAEPVGKLTPEMIEAYAL